MKASIEEKKEIAEGTLMVKFRLSGELNFKPGQYFFVSLINPPYMDGRGALRHFSIVNSPNEKRVITMTTRLRDSAFKKSLKEMPLGSEVNISSIEGNFVLPEDLKRPLVFLAGGIGITPYISMLRYAKEENLPTKITLLYSNKDQKGTAYLEELLNLDKSNPNFKLVLTMTEDKKWKGESGRIDGSFIKKYVKDLKEPLFYVSGPPAMVSAIKETLKELNLNPANIKAESFSGY